MKRKTAEERYFYNVRKQTRELEDFVLHETEWANDLINWYKIKKQEMPDEEYRACAFFLNSEFLNKPGSLTLLYQMHIRCNEELPECTKENAFDLLRFKYKMYTEALQKGGFN